MKKLLLASLLFSLAWTAQAQTIIPSQITGASFSGTTVIASTSVTTPLIEDPIGTLEMVIDPDSSYLRIYQNGGALWGFVSLDTTLASNTPLNGLAFYNSGTPYLWAYIDRDHAFLPVAGFNLEVEGAFPLFITAGASSSVIAEFEPSDLNVALFGSGSWGSGSKVLFVANAATVPSTNPIGGGILYTQGGALKFRGSSGTVTTIANP